LTSDYYLSISLILIVFCMFRVLQSQISLIYCLTWYWHPRGMLC